MWHTRTGFRAALPEEENAWVPCTPRQLRRKGGPVQTPDRLRTGSQPLAILRIALVLALASPASVVAAYPSGSSAVGGSVTQSAAPGPLDCGIPGYDDKCEAWVAFYNTPETVGFDENAGVKAATSPDGRYVYVAGPSRDGNQNPSENGDIDYLILAYDVETGEPVWVSRYDGGKRRPDFPTDLAVSPDGAAIYVTGAQNASNDIDNGIRLNGEYGTVALDAETGAQLWSAAYMGSGGPGGQAFSLAVAPDGDTLFVAGASPGSASGYDFATLAYDTSDGSESWVARHDGSRGGRDVARALAISSDGERLFVTGGEGNEVIPGLAYGTVAYKAQDDPDTLNREGGEELWVASRDTSGYTHEAYSIAMDPSESKVYVSGGFSTIAYDAAYGDQLWATDYTRAQNRCCMFWQLAVSPDGDFVYLAGPRCPGACSNDTDYVTLAFNPVTGAIVGEAILAGSALGSEGPTSLAASTGRVYVTGTSESGTTFGRAGTHCMTVAYDASLSSPVWVASYLYSSDLERWNVERPESRCFGLALTPDGKRLVATGSTFSRTDGTAIQGGDAFDLLFLAYDTAENEG